MLKKENYLKCLILNILTCGLFTFYIGKKLKVYDKSEWYAYYYVWFLGLLFGIYPAIFMFILFYIQIGVEVSKKIGVPLENFYAYPYVWILSLIVPFVGWSVFILLLVYVHIWYAIYLKRGYGEKYI